MAKTLLKIFLLCCFVLTPAVVFAQYIEVPFKDQSPNRTFVFEAPNARATVVFFHGGDGVLDLKPDGSNNRTNVPLVRAATLWRNYAINYVMVDSPYDLGDYRRGHKRGDSDHLDRAASVIGFYENKYKLPTWAVGHSMGSATVTRLANRGGSDPKLSGIIVAGTLRGESLTSNFKLPVLAIHHAQDQCSATPVSASKSIIQSREASLKSRLVLIEGGFNVGHECRGFAVHGFNNVEDQVVAAAAKFILED